MYIAIASSHVERVFVVVSAYGAGLLVTDLALILMGRGQPALLYLVPFVLGTTFIVAWQRKEVKQIWDGKPVNTKQMFFTLHPFSTL